MLSFFYNHLASAAAPILHLYLKKRLAKGKEHPNRMKERFGEATLSRWEGQLIWFHAASVGELISLLPLLNALKNENILVTTGTVNAAKVFDKLNLFNCIHQFIPLDVPSWIKRFLDHWQPSLAVFTESELWPNMVASIHTRDIPLILLNARLTDQSFRRWTKWAPKMAKDMLRKFDKCLAQSGNTAEKLRRLGCEQVFVTGNLKFAANPLPYDLAELNRLNLQIGQRPVWIAASTHLGEDPLMLAVHAQIKQKFPNVLTILVPRHPHRGDTIEAEIMEAGLNAARRSRGDIITPETDVYLADTIGEMGLFYALSPIVFVAGSFVPIGGHNPIEPALLKCAIISGPHIHNFIEVYDALKGCYVQAETPQQLGQVVIEFMQHPDTAEKFAQEAFKTVQTQSRVVETVMVHLQPYLLNKFFSAKDHHTSY